MSQGLIEGHTYMVKGADHIAHSNAVATQAVYRIMIAERLLTEEQAESAVRLQLSPAFSYPWSTLFCALGRKPVETT